MADGQVSEVFGPVAAEVPGSAQVTGCAEQGGQVCVTVVAALRRDWVMPGAVVGTGALAPVSGNVIN